MQVAVVQARDHGMPEGVDHDAVADPAKPELVPTGIG
jgi:hypothetical protein